MNRLKRADSPIDSTLTGAPDLFKKIQSTIALSEYMERRVPEALRRTVSAGATAPAHPPPP